jgi:YHS domain-containing protein
VYPASFDYVAATTLDEAVVRVRRPASHRRSHRALVLSDGLIAAMGHGDEETLQAALAGPAGYLGPVVSARRAAAALHVAPATAVARVTEAIDPVCGMAVVVRDDAEPVEVDGVVYDFCCAGCRARLEADRARYAPSVSS